MRGCLVGFFVFLVLGFMIPFISDENSVDSYGTSAITLMSTIVFGSFFIITWRKLRKLPFADIASDDDGIWPMHLGKINGLISWKDIFRLRERSDLQCLDLLDIDGEKLLRIEYQLVGFEIIRQQLYEKSCNSNSDSNKLKYTKGSLYHFSYLVCILAFSALGLFVALNGYSILGYCGVSMLVAAIVYEYLTAVARLDIGRVSFDIRYPITRRNILYSDIENILITDEFHKGHRISEVWIVVKGVKNPFKLKKLNVDSNILYKAIRKAASI